MLMLVSLDFDYFFVYLGLVREDKVLVCKLLFIGVFDYDNFFIISE